VSVQALSWVFDNSKAEHAARLVLISIANHADKFGRNAWPSVTSIGKEALLSERVVRTSLRQLETIGELKVIYGGGPHRSNLYSLPKMNGANPAPTEGAESAPTDGAEFVEVGQHSSIDGAEFVSAIRKNRTKPSFKPSRGVIPKDQPPLNCARRLMEILSLPQTPGFLRTVEASVIAEAGYLGMSAADASQHIADHALRAGQKGQPIDRFYFEDTKWRNDGKRQISKAVSNVIDTRSNLLDAAREHAAARVGSVRGELKNGSR